jgi:predicted amidohydrolase YtcJ
MRLWLRLSTAYLSCAIVAFAFASQASAQTADLVVLNGKVFTADERSSLAEGFAIKDGRFIAAGSSAAMRAHVGPATKVVDLGGRFVVPGLADGHLHGVSGGPGIDLAETRSLDELFAVVGRAAKDTQPGAVIMELTATTRRSSRRSACRRRASSINMRRSIRWCWCAAGMNMCSTRRRSPNGNHQADAIACGRRIGKEEDGELNGELVDNARTL